MKIVRILAYRIELPLHETTYKWSGGKSVSVFDSTIVRVETDTGHAGHGEVCPLGPFTCPLMPRACARVCVSSGHISSAKIRVSLRIALRPERPVLQAREARERRRSYGVDRRGSATSRVDCMAAQAVGSRRGQPPKPQPAALAARLYQ